MRHARPPYNAIEVPLAQLFAQGLERPQVTFRSSDPIN